MKESSVTLKVGNEDIKGKLFIIDKSRKSDVISLHGAGQSTKERIVYLLKGLEDRIEFNAGIFDFSGHGESTGKLEESNLEKRTNEASAFIKEYGTDHPVIIGSSMGGYIALKMLEVFTPKSLILFCPALYSQEAYSTPFTNQFTEILRKPDSWKDTDVLSPLQNFKGNLLVFIGTEDTVIPPGVIDLIDQNSNNTKKKEIIKISGSPHGIHAYINEHPEVREMVISKILECGL
jgi:pimeloyl-ACP methyl ester carboxylesterase